MNLWLIWVIIVVKPQYLISQEHGASKVSVHQWPVFSLQRAALVPGLFLEQLSSLIVGASDLQPGLTLSKWGRFIKEWQDPTWSKATNLSIWSRSGEHCLFIKCTDTVNKEYLIDFFLFFLCVLFQGWIQANASSAGLIVTQLYGKEGITEYLIWWKKTLFSCTLKGYKPMDHCQRLQGQLWTLLWTVSAAVVRNRIL